MSIMMPAGINVEYFSVTLVDNTGLALPKSFGSKFVVGVCILEQQANNVFVDDLKFANSAGTVTITANFTGNVTKVCELAVFYRE